MRERHQRMSGGGLLVLLRHGESGLNSKARYSGWSDSPLTAEGIRQAHDAGRELRDAGIVFDACFTSVLSRAVETATIVLGELGIDGIPLTKTWRLNERNYGRLEGMLKSDAAARYGAAQVEAWRNGADAAPPQLDAADPRHPRNCALYGDVAPELLPSSENLRDAFRRVVDFYEDGIRPLVESGRRVLVVSHGNPIRALVAHLGGLPEGEVPIIVIQNARPIVYGPGATPSFGSSLRRYSGNPSCR